MDVEVFLKERYDSLPLHAVCYKYDTSYDEMKHLLKNDKDAARKKDGMGLTALHVLVTNPSITKPMLTLLCNSSNAATEKDMFGRYPLHFLCS
eukprot:8448514-Ditylum_brightwellii.AAC.1